MKQIGVDIKIANVDSTKFFGEWLPNGNFDIANFAWVGTPVRDLRQPGHLPDRRRQQLRPVLQQEGRRRCSRRPTASSTEAKAAELGNQIDQQITADMATIPLYQKPTFIAWRNTFANIADNSTHGRPLLERQHLGAEDRLEPRRTGNALDAGRWETAGPRRVSRHVL